MINSVSSSSFAAMAQSLRRGESSGVAKSDDASAKGSVELSPKAAAIAKALEAGEYKIDLGATAKAIASELV